MRTNLRYGAAVMTDVAVGKQKVNTLQEVPRDQEWKEHFLTDCQTSRRQLRGGGVVEALSGEPSARSLSVIYSCGASQLMAEESVVFSITEPHTSRNTWAADKSWWALIALFMNTKETIHKHLKIEPGKNTSNTLAQTPTSLCNMWSNWTSLVWCTRRV